ncbi:1-(5-phosphoribosyl)-5-[(5-phosphoribosylamino)methylideneamino] imidazole-4-carboxamide isomerase [Clostridium cavendishii DSM 21758]|uniref:1-(5-phosphoribosyl)-5-[(5-phosphoribosylamino)methylideneamino] imidazole-4-carboxamide isomerase n=1 Tax=Clostridium cavendishii DSM 21758 TaxID=1121302 RepID=A0A1M6F217_9CLOT|nr:1-(5-phosphoribosyl)-5-[(5-phosphoribosylamino)methylideneamino]imidazole-4-carboxamide isomerase [Clostridium cavendishii]SHI91705.1 1-(5-phosphoribosyl)-5-[(5-phosphoribosylamino)methylideneamino] imidazole-4-carboxamide isomerase [Clostridium cavendishii DSM 21758]
MIIIPAIDIRNGKAVRLYKGDYSKEEIVAESVIKTALDFKNQGAEYIHIVDLDGAKIGALKNFSIIKEVIDITKIKVEVGGGIRNIDTIKKLIDLGVEKVILGTAALNDLSLLKLAVKEYGEKIAIAIDFKDGYVYGRGWVEKSNINFLDMSKSLEKIGISNIIVTDIDKDGTLNGPSYEALRVLNKVSNIKITASGGIRDIQDIKKLKEMNLYAAITGKAIYSKTLNLKEALVLCKLEV